MANRRDYYFRQKVTEAELDAGFTGLETADFNLAVDNDLTGIVDGASVSQHAGTPNLTVDVQGPGTAYSKLGERISFSSTQNVNVAVDDASASTAVGTPGNEKWISVFLEFDRSLTDPRIDGNSVTVFFVRDESFAFSVVQGAEAAIGAGTRPALDPNKLLLADIRRTNGVTQILNAEIYTNRREDAFRMTSGTVDVVAGTPREAIQDLLDALNDHIDGVANKHPASQVTYAGSGNWASGAPLSGSPANVEAAIDTIVSDLAAVASVSGAERIGIKAAILNWADGSTIWTAQSLNNALTQIVTKLQSVTTSASGARAIGIEGRTTWLGGRTNPFTTLYAALDKIITDLAATGAGDDGAERIGIQPRTTWLGGRTNPSADVFAAIDKIITDLALTTAADDGAERIGAAAGTNLSAGSVRSQLDELDAEKAGLALSNTFTNNNTFNETIATAKSIQSMGSSLLGTLANALVARLSGTIANTGVTNRTLITEFTSPNGTPKYRVYLTSSGSGVFSLDVTLNARWDGTNWNADNAALDAIRYQLNQVDFRVEYKTAAASWGESSWTYVTRDNMGAKETIWIDGSWRVQNATTGGSNSSTPLGINTLQAKNIPKAWLKGFGLTTIDDEFGIATLTDDGSQGAVVTFDHSADSTFHQSIVVSSSGTSATAAQFLSVDNYAVNACTVRAWRWNGTAIVQTTHGDWGLQRFARTV